MMSKESDDILQKQMRGHLRATLRQAGTELPATVSAVGAYKVPPPSRTCGGTRGTHEERGARHAKCRRWCTVYAFCEGSRLRKATRILFYSCNHVSRIAARITALSVFLFTCVCAFPSGSGMLHGDAAGRPGPSRCAERTRTGPDTVVFPSGVVPLFYHFPIFHFDRFHFGERMSRVSTRNTGPATSLPLALHASAGFARCGGE